MLAVRAWERLNGKAHDWNLYETDIVPVLSVLTVPELVSLTGLSRHYCWQVRAGKKRLHPMHWERVLAFDVDRAKASELRTPNAGTMLRERRRRP